MTDQAQKKVNSTSRRHQDTQTKQATRPSAGAIQDRGRITKLAPPSSIATNFVSGLKQTFRAGHTLGEYFNVHVPQNYTGDHTPEERDNDHCAEGDAKAHGGEDDGPEDVTSSRSKKRKDGGGLFGRDIAPRNLRFPASGNITAVEILTFIPEWLRSMNIVNRIVQNGFTTDDISKVINHHRQSPKSHKAMNNSLVHIMKKPMKECGFDAWNIGKHHSGTFDDLNQNWDPDNLSLSGLQVQCEIHSGDGNGDAPLQSVPFTTLAVGVNVFPDLATGDGLDLTRCVAFAVQNPTLDLQFPRDFDTLTKHLGQTPVRPEHFDRSAAARWHRTPKLKETPTSASVVIPVPMPATDTKKAVAGTNSAKARHHALTKGNSKAMMVPKVSHLPVQRGAAARTISLPRDNVDIMEYEFGALQKRSDGATPGRSHTPHQPVLGIAGQTRQLNGSQIRAQPDESPIVPDLQLLNDVLSGRVSLATAPIALGVKHQNSTTPYWMTKEFDEYLADLIDKADE